jgi:hypothetical protein
MRRRIAIGAGAVAIGVGATVLVIGVAGERDPYAALRQVSEQPIPGALGYALEPPPDDAVAVLSPRDVQRRYPAGGGDVEVTFASIRDTLADRSVGHGWVLLARGVCLRNAKGELVSDARGTDPLDLDCTDATIWVLAVDATTAEPLVALTGYDPDGTWAPDRAGP